MCFAHASIIDCTEDDSILRLLSSGSVADVSRRTLFKLSNLPENVAIERLRLVSGVKFAAMQGSFAVLSQTEPVNESFYDLFNQRFREINGRDGKLTLYANIAVGGISRRSLVDPNFECVVHIRHSNMHQIPAPFLNRFEKYRLKLTDVLFASWSRYGKLSSVVANALDQLRAIVTTFSGGNNLLGWADNHQTLESIFIDMLPCLDVSIWSRNESEATVVVSGTGSLLEDSLVEFIEKVTSLSHVREHVQKTIASAIQTLPDNLSRQLGYVFQTSNEYHRFQECCQSLLSNDSDETLIVQLYSVLVQMVLTRVAACRIIQLATPESIFVNR